MNKSIGRGVGNDIRINSAQVSDIHAQLIQEESGQVFVQDLSSTNGTFVNGKKITALTPLFSGDRLTIGDETVDWESHTGQGISSNTVRSTRHSNTKVLQYALPLIVLVVLAGLAYSFMSSSESTIAEADEGDSKEEPNSSKEGVEYIWNGTTYEYNGKTYDFDCLPYGIVHQGSDIRVEFVNEFGSEVSIEEEMEAGYDCYQELEDAGDLVFNSDYQRLQNILSRCAREIPNPRGFDYKVYLVGSDELNAFTVGGYIFFYQGMLDFVENDDELAAIMGHEIFHNELEHVRQNLSEMKTIQELNPFGGFFEDVLLSVNQILSSPFNQKQEAECDLHGIDLMMAAGYNGCASASLWERMAEYGEDMGVLNVISSHPYSGDRKVCCENHIAQNYPNHSCN